MKRWAFAVAFCLAACTGDSTPIRTSEVPLTSVSVDVDRYMGLWYEIARYPNRFEEGCVGVTAEYKRLSKKRINVKNTCRKDSLDGPVEVADGRARVVGDGQLKVSFLPGGLSFLDGVASGGYWVIWLEPDYRMAVVVSPGNEFGWILAREPQPDSNVTNTAVQALKDQGYRTDALIWVKQPPEEDS
ncbi:MAG: lipocalin family protein [Pseudomonadota bacterium]